MTDTETATVTDSKLIRSRYRSRKFLLFGLGILFRSMFVLGIESTCDETACAVVQDGRHIMSNVVASQHDLHAIYGGVFPEVACRRHIEIIGSLVKQALKEAGLNKHEIDLIAAAKGPGLIGALIIGMNMAKGLAFGLDKPFIGVNHVEAHLYAAMMEQDFPKLPALGVVISGGHTFLVRIEELGRYTLIGTTVDDAIGEAFDKVAVMLGLPFPGGPAVEALARQGDPHKYPFRSGKVKGRPWDFSFSGMKTAVLYAVKGPSGDRSIPDEEKPHIAASFQETALNDVVERSLKAAESYGCKAIYLGGGVSNNSRLRALFSQKSPLQVFWPPLNLSLDNGAMIAGLGYHQFLRHGADPLSLSPQARISLL